MKHTKGPWKLEIGKDECFHDGNRVSITVDWEDGGESGKVTIAEVWPAENDRDIDDGNFIVTACNLHDELVEALKDVLLLAGKGIGGYERDRGPRLLQIENFVVEVLAKARGEEA